MSQKAVISLVDFSLKPYGVLRLYKDDLTLTADISLVSKMGTDSYCIVIFSRESFTVLNEPPATVSFDCDFKNLAILIVQNNNPAAFFKRGHVSQTRENLYRYFLTQKNSPGTYDDEQLATENYYQKEGVYLECQKITDNADLEKARPKNGQAKERTAQACCDEAHDEYVTKPQSFTCKNAPNTQGCGVSCEASQGFFARRRQEFLSHLNLASRVFELEAIVPKSRFYNAGNNSKPYFFGVISLECEPRYLAYAVEGEAACPPSGFEGAFFVPRDYFNTNTGFYLLIQDALTGAKI